MWSRKRSPFQVLYKKDDCFYEVVSPLGVTVARFVNKKQAVKFVEHILKGVVEDGPEKTDTV